MADSPFDVELHEADDLSETIKCGAVQLNLEKLAFSFTCVYCELEFCSLRLFAEHFQQHLVMTDTENEIFLRNAEEDSENMHSMDESIQDGLSNSNMMPSDEDNPEVGLRDYQIEMLDDTTQDNVEILSNNENTSDQFVYEVRVLKSEEEESQAEKTMQPNNNEAQQCEIETLPDLGFDVVPDVTLVTGLKIKKETNYICEICGVKFAEASTLQLHIQRHNRCQFCHTHFSSKAQLKQHIKTHAAQKPFVCEECGQSFKNAESLKTHQKHHVPEELYLCNTCGKSFYEERALRDHILTHTSARPYICKECNMTFSRQEALMLHASMHSDIRKFSCTICRMTFAQNSGLLAHMKEKHRSSFDNGE